MSSTAEENNSNSNNTSTGGFFDKFVAKIKQLSAEVGDGGDGIDRQSYQTSAAFEEIIPACGLLGSTSKFTLTAAADTNKLVNEIATASHVAPNAELPRILDETFADVAEAIKLIDVAIGNERYNLQLARQRTKDHAKPLSDAIGKEVSAVEKFLQLNLRVKIDKKNYGKNKYNSNNDQQQQQSIEASKNNNNTDNEHVDAQTESQSVEVVKKGDVHLEMYKKWTDHSHLTEKFEQIEEERKKWDDIISKYEKK